MKIKLLNTVQGLKPLYDEDFDEKKKLKIGGIYEADVKKARNLQFHKKFFALINCAWEYQNEKVVEFFHHSKDAFRKTVVIAAGWYEPVYSIDKKEWTQNYKSIAFDKMDEAEFMDLYDNVKRVLFQTFLRHIDKEEFIKNLINF